MIKAVLFDVDGVILDSDNSSIKYFSDLTAFINGKPTSKKKIKIVMYYTGREVVDKLLPKMSLKDKIKVISFGYLTYPRYMKYIKLTRGIEDVLEKLSKKYTLGIVTGRRREVLFYLLRKYKIRKYFKVIVSESSYKKPKPNPEPVLTAIKKLRLVPAHTVYIGDQDIDKKAAKSAGVKFIHFDNRKSTNKPGVLIKKIAAL